MRNLSNFQLLKAMKGPKIMLKNCVWCYHLIIKYQKDIKKSQAITIKEFGQRSFVTPCDHCALHDSHPDQEGTKGPLTGKYEYPVYFNRVLPFRTNSRFKIFLGNFDF